MASDHVHQRSVGVIGVTRSTSGHVVKDIVQANVALWCCANDSLFVDYVYPHGLFRGKEHSSDLSEQLGHRQKSTV